MIDTTCYISDLIQMVDKTCDTNDLMQKVYVICDTNDLVQLGDIYKTNDMIDDSLTSHDKESF